MSENTCIAIVGHQAFQKTLPAQYLFIRRSSESELIPDIDINYIFKAPSFVWSEYAAWFENSKLFIGKDITGLLHYRCALNLLPFSLPTFPIALFSKFLSVQNRLLQKKKNFLFVGHPNELKETVWKQFSDAHPESVEILEEACRYYDSVIDFSKGPAAIRLKSMSHYYPRNIFLTDTNFSNEWMQYSFTIAMKLDSKFDETPNNRWGGFVLERLFTLFVDDYRENNVVNFKTYQQTYLISFLTWIKIKLLKINLVQKLRSRYLA